MLNLIKSIQIIILIALLQLSIYQIFLKPIITTWGATKNEISMPMAGDDKHLTVTATRAILINENKNKVWKLLIQLGADRGGFYSYDFIERMMGYKTRHQDADISEFKEIKAGDLVRGSIDEKSAIIPYNFRVLYVKPKEMFVLDKWGTFLLEEMNDHQTRLVIRSQEVDGSNIWQETFQYIMVPLHFIMERRTLMGIKMRAEALENSQLSKSKDIFWFIGIVLSGFLIPVFIFIGRGTIQSFILPCIFATFWVFALLLFDPIPMYSLGLLLAMCGYWISMRLFFPR